MTYVLTESLFVERKTFLQLLRERLEEGLPVAIGAPGGLGKTTIAQAYAHHFSEEYQHILWLDATTEQTLLASSGNLIEQLALPVSQGNFQHMLHALRDWLIANQNGLLILDHVTPQTLPLVPLFAQDAWHVLLTTRLQKLEGSSIRSIELPGLDLREGSALLLSTAGLLPYTDALPEKSDIALELVRELHGFPLALSLAGIFVRETGQSLEEYLQSYRSISVSSVTFASSPGDLTEVVATSWAVLSAHLAKAQPASLEFLRFCAVLAHHAIPLSLFEEGEATDQEYSLLSQIYSAHQAIETLSTSGLVTRQDNTRTLVISPLLLELLRSTLPLSEQRRLVEQAFYVLDQQLPSLETNITPECSRYLSLIQQLDMLSQDWTFTFEEAASVFSWGAAILLQQERYAETEHLLRRALVIWERTLGTQDSLVVTTLHNLASLNEKQGNYVEAEMLLQRAIMTGARTLRADHPETIRMLISLAQVYTHQNKIREAELTYQKAHAFCAHGIGAKHPLAIAIQYSLANLYIEKYEASQQGKASEAESLLQEVSAFYEKKFGAGHLKTARVLHKLALVFLGQQNWEQAEIVLQKVRVSYEQHIGAEQPETIEMLYQLAFARAIQQKWDTQTVDLFHTLGIAYTHMLGDDHANTLEIYSNLALVYIAHQMWQLAEPLLQYVHSSYERTLGPEHLDTARALHSLAEVNMEQQHWEQAEALYERTLAIYTRTLGQAHLETLNCLQQMILLYQHQEQFAKVTALQQRIQHTWEELVEGSDTPEMVVSLSGLAGLYIEQERFIEAERLLQRALAICRRHPEVGLITLALVLQNMARVYSGQGKDKQAALLLRRVAAIQETIASFGPFQKG